MATLSQMCVLPEGWGAPSVSKQIGMSKKLAWKTAKRAEHERLMAYREREKKRCGMGGGSLERSRQRVHRETMAEPIGIESRGEMFYLGKGERSPKKAKNPFQRGVPSTYDRESL